MLSIQQLIKALRKLQNSGATTASSDLGKQNIKQVVAAASTTTIAPTKHTEALNSLLVNLTLQSAKGGEVETSKTLASQLSVTEMMISPSQPHECGQQLLLATNSSQIQEHQKQSYQQKLLQHSHTCADINYQSTRLRSVSLASPVIENDSLTAGLECQINVNSLKSTQVTNYTTLAARSQSIHKFYQQQLLQFDTEKKLKNKRINTMSSLKAEHKSLKQDETIVNTTNGHHVTTDVKNKSDISCKDSEQTNSSDKPCFNTGLGEIIKFMELIGNLKHTKRTGWVLRNVSDPESISGHMYRMSMMTFLLDGSEGLNQIRCMELALVHDLAESVVGDLTPFCGVSKSDKRAMELKAMEDICKLIEPRGKRIMELFEEYENGESAESKFVKDLDRLDLIMQAFEYEKRDNCLLKHQEFFDSNEGKFNHPFVKKLVDEIYVQRQNLAHAQGATPPPPVVVPDTETLPNACSQCGDETDEKVEATEASATTTPKTKS